MPKALGAQIEFYHLEFVPVMLNVTACVVATERIMHYFHERDRARENRSPPGSFEAGDEATLTEEVDEGRDEGEASQGWLRIAAMQANVGLLANTSALGGVTAPLL